MTCCRDVPRPTPWKAGEYDSAEPEMVAAMDAVADRLSYETPLPEFIGMCRAASNFDSRTMLGGDLQRCLLHNAAARLDLLAHSRNPHPWASLKWRVRDAWRVLRGQSVALRIN